MKHFLAIIVIAVCCFTGCKLNLNTLTPGDEMRSKQIEKKLTEQHEIVYKKWRTLWVYATLIHKSLASIHHDVPDQGKTKITFRLRGLEQYFDITQMIFTVTTGQGHKYVITGLGTDYILVNGKINSQFEYVEIEKKGGEKENLLNKFSITMPFETTNATKFIHIQVDDIRDKEHSFGLMWDFGE